MTWNRLQQRLHNGETDSLLGDLVDHCGSHPCHADGHYSLGLLLERLQQPLDALHLQQLPAALRPAVLHLVALRLVV